ncbi:MAG: sigma-54-dependent Fis family transcriptional regulator [Deltaproteobacteria bacterium]|nr:MAG: sigma-54-dependent Fis family transcriptional regulator [Deltaproteobacteria bacterium]
MTAPTQERYRILALDDQRETVLSLQRALRPRGFDTEPYTDAARALDALASQPDSYDAALFDVVLPDVSGIDVLRRAKRIAPDLPVVMLTGDERAKTAVQALHAGAFGYLTKSTDDVDSIAHTLAQAARQRLLQRRAAQLERSLERVYGFEHMIGQSAAMRRVFDAVTKVAESDFGVLVRGESGTGKELVARAIHERSARASGPFVALNCAALPEALVDSELFGHERGAFTGAVGAREGAFERANGGTLFLDEIGDIPPAVQLRLLRVLQEREVVRVGGGAPRPVDVRVIAATHVDLERAVSDGRFRQDLYYRLNVVHIDLPPLRDRLDDVPLLVAHFVAKHADRSGHSPPTFSPAAIEALCSYDWPGNVRELENVVQRLLALVPGDEIRPEHLPSRVVGASSGRLRAVVVPEPQPVVDDLAWTDGMPFAEARRLVQERFERAYVTRLLDQVDGNIAEAARRAGMDRSNFRRVMIRAGVTADKPRRA